MDHDSSPELRASSCQLVFTHSLSLLSTSWPHFLLLKMNFFFALVWEAKEVDERETWPQMIQAPQSIPCPHVAPD